MTITVELPDDLLKHADPARDALVEFAIECYRKEALSLRRAAALLDMYWGDFEGLLKARGVMEGAYDEEDLRLDIEAGDRFRELGLLPCRQLICESGSADDEAA